MAEDESGRGLGGNSLQIRTIPGGDGRGKQAGRRPKLGFGVESYSKAIGVVVASSCILQCRSDLGQRVWTAEAKGLGE